ncbi:MAG: BamA/TamA family outer membrane protein, partial [Bdellovibrionales bacterium]|nr:BamA/TamA family outer membrane protein [Bdellovibrionales bacterium]
LRTLEVGAGANSTLGLHLFGEATEKGIFKDGRSLGLRLDGYYDVQSDDISQGIANFRFRVPEVSSSPFTYTNDLRFQKLDSDTFEYDVERVALDTSVYRTFGVSSFSLSHGLQQDNLSNVSPDVILSSADQGNVLLSYLNLNFSFDRRDNPINPSGGYFLRFDSSLSSSMIGSDESFFSLGGKFSTVQDLGESPFSIAYSLQTGGAWGFDDTEQIPITQRFYLGGRTSLRGFRENSLGPKGSQGGVIGGDFLLAQNLEFRYRVFETLSTHIFFDAGNVYLMDQGIDLGDTRESTGLGFRYLSPIGPIGLDFGTPLDEREGEPSIRIHFSVGTSF